MEGITNHIYRDVASRVMDMDIICTEFVRLSGHEFHPNQVRDEIECYDDMTLSVQLMGEDPKLFAETVPYFEEKGVKIIDLNLGCPSARVNRRSCGAAMLTDRELLKTVVAAIRKSCTVTFSCKIRAGWDTTEPALEIAKILEGEGIDFLTVHPRTRQQKYKGNANWDITRSIKEAASIPIIGNGDIFSIYDAEDMINYTKCDGIMMGRGVLRDPFLLNKISPYLNNREIIEIPLASYEHFYSELAAKMAAEAHPDNSILNKLKEHFRYFTLIFNNSAELWEQIKRCQSVAEYFNTFWPLANASGFKKAERRHVTKSA
jgi:nifR3 family TIM-barrel protein